MSATEIANAYVALYTKMPGVEGDIRRSLGGAEAQFDEAGASGGRKFSGAAAAAIAAGALVVAGAVSVVTSKAVMAFGELEQNVGGAEAVFGKYADTVQKQGVEAYKNLGLSQSDYLATANKMGALFQGSGVEQARAVDLTTEAMQRAADMASVMGIEQSVAMESVAGAAKGNFTMMDNLGVAMNATSIEAYAASKGMTDWSFATATAAEKAEMAMGMFMDSTSQYAGNFAREATETVTGSIGLMGAAWDSLIAGFGDPNADMSQLTSNLVGAMRAVVENVAPVVGEIFASLPEVLSSLGAELGPMFSELFSGLAGGSGLGELIGQFVEMGGALSPLGILLQGLAPLLPQIAELFGQIFDAVMPLAQELGAALVPIISQLFTALMPIVQAILPVLMVLFEQLSPIVTMLVDAFTPLLQPILDMITPLLGLVEQILPPLTELFGFLVAAILPAVQAGIGALVPVIDGVVKGLTEFLVPATKVLGDVLDGLIKFITGVFSGDWEKAWGGIVDVFTGLWEGIPGVVVGIVNGIIDLINGVIGGINGIADGVSDFTGGAVNVSIPTIPHLAEGGIVKARPGGIPAVVGEGRYDEAVIPLSPSVLSQLGGGGGMPSHFTLVDDEGAIMGRLRVVARDAVVRAARPVSRQSLASSLGV